MALHMGTVGCTRRQESSLSGRRWRSPSGFRMAVEGPLGHLKEVRIVGIIDLIHCFQPTPFYYPSSRQLSRRAGKAQPDCFP